jgi:hypothetical protein
MWGRIYSPNIMIPTFSGTSSSFVLYNRGGPSTSRKGKATVNPYRPSEQPFGQCKLCNATVRSWKWYTSVMHTSTTLDLRDRGCMLTIPLWTYSSSLIRLTNVIKKSYYSALFAFKSSGQFFHLPRHMLVHSHGIGSSEISVEPSIIGRGL